MGDKCGFTCKVRTSGEKFGNFIRNKRTDARDHIYGYKLKQKTKKAYSLGYDQVESNPKKWGDIYAVTKMENDEKAAKARGYKRAGAERLKKVEQDAYWKSGGTRGKPKRKSSSSAVNIMNEFLGTSTPKRRTTRRKPTTKKTTTTRKRKRRSSNSSSGWQGSYNTLFG